MLLQLNNILFDLERFFPDVQMSNCANYFISKNFLSIIKREKIWHD